MLQSRVRESCSRSSRPAGGRGNVEPNRPTGRGWLGFPNEVESGSPTSRRERAAAGGRAWEHKLCSIFGPGRRKRTPPVNTVPIARFRPNTQDQRRRSARPGHACSRRTAAVPGPPATPATSRSSLVCLTPSASQPREQREHDIARLCLCLGLCLCCPSPDAAPPAARRLALGTHHADGHPPAVAHTSQLSLTRPAIERSCSSAISGAPPD